MAGNMTDAERSAQRLTHSLDALNRAINEASHESIDKATEAFKELIKQTGALSDEERSKIKDIRGAYDALEKTVERQRQKSKELRDIQEKLRQGTLTTIRAHQELANKGISATSTKLSDLNKAIDENIAATEKSTEALEDQVKAQTREMQKFSVRMKKFQSDTMGKLESSVLKMATVGYAVSAIGAAAKDVYKNLTKLADKGLLSTWITINNSALQLRMGADELIAVIDKNRDVITSMGGGVKGIESFVDNIDIASQGLEYMGKEGKKAAGQFMAVFNRNGLTSAEYVKNSKKYNESFRKFQGMFGTTTDEFADYLETLQNGQQIQSKVMSGDKRQIEAAQNEVRLRVENAAALGLSTQQLVQMNKTLEQMYQPNKNRQSEVMRERIYRRMALQASANDAERSGDTDAAEKIRGGLNDLDAFERASPQDKLKYKSVLQAMSSAKAYDTRSRNGDEASFNNYIGRMAMDRGNMGVYADLGDKVNMADQRNIGKNMGGAVSGTGGTLNADGSISDTGVTKAVTAVRTITEQATSALDSHFTPAVKAAAAAVLALAGSSAVSAGMNVLKGGASKLPGALGRGAGALGRGAGIAGRAALGAAGPAAALAGAGLAGWEIGQGINWGFEKITGDTVGGKLYDWFNKDPMASGPTKPKIEDLRKIQEKLKQGMITEVRAHQELANKGIHATSTKLTDLNKAIDQNIEATEKSTEASTPRARSVAPMVSTAPAAASGSGAKYNEQMMSKALDDAGVTDPKQKAILMGQLAHESGGFKYTRELASGAAYEGRRDLGNTQAGDGMRYKGRGFIQLTGRSNYERAGKALGLDLVNNPDMAADPAVASKIAVWYMNDRKNRQGKSVMDMAASGDVNAVTKMINGGYNGLQDRMLRTNMYMAQYSRPSMDGTMMAAAGVPTTSSADGQAGTTDALMKEQNAILARIAMNTSPRMERRDGSKQDKRAALEQG